MNALARTLAALRRVDDPRPMLWDPAAGPSPQEILAEEVESITSDDDELSKAIVARCNTALANEIVRLVRAWRAGTDLDEAAQGICDELGPVVQDYAVDVLEGRTRAATLPEIRAIAESAVNAYRLMGALAPGDWSGPTVVCVEEVYADHQPQRRVRRVVFSGMAHSARVFVGRYLAERGVYVTVCGEDRL